MSTSAFLKPQPAPVVAFTIARNLENFDPLIDEMEAAMGELWGDLDFSDAVHYLHQSQARALEFVVLAVDGNDEGQLPRIEELVGLAKGSGIKVLLLANNVTPAALQRLKRLRAEAFLAYPLGDNALSEAISRLRGEDRRAAAASQMAARGGGRIHQATVLAVHGLAGGAGSSTFAVNLAWELATVAKTGAPRVCLLDLDLQFGSQDTYLNLKRREAIDELLSDTDLLDDTVFEQALQTFRDRLSVLTAPSELLPLDIVSGEDIDRILSLARARFDYVVIDMPRSITPWTETVMQHASLYFTVMELDMRSAQNALRLLHAIKEEGLPSEKLRFVLNRAPRMTDLGGKARVRRLAETLGIVLELRLPDGGRQVAESNDHGLPLGVIAPRNPLRREIRTLASSMHNVGSAMAQHAG